MLSRLLVSLGHYVRTAHSIASARAMCQSEPFDLLLCDVGLPDGDGTVLADLARDCKARAIAMTGYTPDSHALERFDSHLQKPVDFNVLANVIERVTSE